MIQICRLNKIFKNKKRKVSALKDINITFEKNGLSFIIGESGAGKTTLLNMLSLQDKPTSGKIIINNLDVSKLKPSALATIRSTYFGIVFQNLNLIENFTVYQNIIIGLEIQKIKPSKAEVLNILGFLNLNTDILEEKVYNLSGGQRQRVAIARALIKNPDYIICDEPTGSLDDINAHEIMDLLKKISKEKLVIVVSHNLILAKEYADRTITLNNGEVKADSKSYYQENDLKTYKKPVSARLPQKLVWKFAMGSLKKSLPRVIFTFVSFLLTLAVFMASMTIYTFDSRKATEEVVEKENISYFHLGKQNRENPYFRDKFTNKDLEIMDEFYKDSYILSHYSEDFNDSSSINFIFKDDVELQRINNIAYLTEKNFQDCNFSIVGRLPQTQTISEIALTKYECYFLGWLEKEDFNDVNKLQDIINNKKYKVRFYRGDVFGSMEFNICGIIDTNYVFLDKSNPDYDQLLMSQNYYEMHKTLFVCEEDFYDIINITIKEGHDTEVAYSSIYVVTLNGEYSKVPQVIAEYEKEEITIKDNCRVDNIIEQCKDLGKVYGTISFIAGMILLIISLFAFVGFIKSSIEHNRKTMKILRSLGIKIFDCNSIFLLQSTFLCLICSLLSIIPYNIILSGINQYFRKQFSTVVSPLHISFAVIALSFVGLLLIALFTTLIYTRTAFKEKELLIKE